MTGVKQETKVECSTDLKSEEYEEVSKHMVSNQKQKPTKRKAEKVNVVEDPAKKKRREVIGQRSAKLRAVKKLLDTVHNDLQTAENDVTAKMQAKGYPEAMTKWCLDKIQKAKESLWQSRQAKYNSEVTRTITDAISLPELEATAASWDQELQSLQAEWNTYKKEGGKEIAKLMD